MASGESDGGPQATEPAWRILNRANWDERVAVHLNARQFYDQTPLRNGTARLGPIAHAILGAPAGLKILHLQCHFGMDSLTMASQGATVVGLDFSPAAIEAARRLASELGLADRARFVEADLYDARAAIPEPASFDRVFVSWGALCWLPDMRGWAHIVAHFLKPGGWLALAEAHPAALVFDPEIATTAKSPTWSAPYLGRQPLVLDNSVDYADPLTPLRNARTYEWVHPLSDIIMGLIDAGLQLDVLHEHATIAWRLFDCLVETPQGDYGWPDQPWLPLAFSLRARKPA